MSVADDVRARLDIVDVVSERVPLKKAGRSFKARCPFHTENTPSFIVNPDRQTWHCFGACATGGDVFSFVMRAESIQFGEALRLLAERAGVPLANSPSPDRTDPLYRINQEACRFLEDALAAPGGQAASRYLRERGVNDAAASAFHLGFSRPERGALRDHLTTLGFDLALAIEAGLVHRNDDGSTRDFFRGRLMFPIHDRQGRVTGFGARSLDGSEPKYLNTPRTPVFDKRATLYGLHLAADAIRQSGTAVVVEGYMDVIAAHQHGFANVVASMGTALTDRQVAYLKSTASSFVLALDPDAAGQEATLRSLESTWKILEGQALHGATGSRGGLVRREEPSLRVAELPRGKDPDEVIRADPREWERIVGAAVDSREHYISAIASRFDVTTAAGKAQAVEAVWPMITSMANAFDQQRTFEKLAQVLNVTLADLEASVGRPSAPRRRTPRGSAVSASASALSGSRQDKLEDYTLALLVSRPDLKEWAGRVPLDCFHRSQSREMVARLLRAPTIEEFHASLDDGLRSHLELLRQTGPGPDELRSAEAALDQCLRRLEGRHLQELQDTLLASGDDGGPPAREMESAIVGVNARLKQLFASQVRKP